MADEEEIFQMALETFKNFDTSGDGFIDQGELGHFLVTLNNDMGIPPPSLKDIEEVMASLDKNNDGKLSFDEVKPMLVQIMGGILEKQKSEQEKSKMAEEEEKIKMMKDIFNQIDADGSGEIDA